MIKQMLESELQGVLGFDLVTAKKLAESFSEDYHALRLWQGLRSKYLATHSISKKANGMSVIYEIFLLEALTFYDKGKDKLKKLFRENLDYNDKETLLCEFQFSEDYKFQQTHSVPRHLMFMDCDKDNAFKEMFCITKDVSDCSGGTAPICYCKDWLREHKDNVDLYLNLWVERFVEMRNAVVHESFPVVFLPSYEGKETAASFNSSVIDAYPLKEAKRFRSYQSYLDPEIFFSITKNCIKKFLAQKLNQTD